jgi:putative protease
MREQIRQKVELLAPGGDVDSVKAAICAGANAVYCGMADFNARQRASNLTLPQLEQLVQIAHQRQCQLYLTLNTLIFDHEVPQVLALLNDIYRVGIRVVIVQDLGLLHILKTYLPEIEVHASTQLTTHNEGQIAFLAQFGVTQINLSRELSAAEIKPLCRAAHAKAIKVEAFVHGAFCISFSGQCTMSSSLCGKSGNRGACVQPCRRQYSRADHSSKTDAKAVFNLKDNFVFSDADALYDAGVDSFKIEGRIKKFAYVYNVTSAWREQIDALESGQPIKRDDSRLETVFNRKFTAGYIKGSLNADMFIDSSRDQSLKLLANVSGYWADKKILTLDAKVDLATNTEILIYTPDFTFICKGVITKKLSAFEYQFAIEHKLKGKITEGYQVFTQEVSDAVDRIKAKIDTLNLEKTALNITVCGSIGSKLKAVFSTEHASTTLFSHIPLSAASQRPLDHETLFAQFSRLGTSSYVLNKLTISDLPADSFIPQKELNRLRREAIEKLSGIEIKPAQFTIPPIPQSSRSKKATKKALFITDITNYVPSATTSDATVFVIPNSIQDVGQTAAALNKNSSITPYFSSILIGDDFTKALQLLQMLDGRTIITDNTGIADAASQLGIAWIAGPAFNVVNSYAVQAIVAQKGFCGLFLSTEFSTQESGVVQVPPHIDLWHALNYTRPLMTTRQCLIRNISGCHKNSCDDDCVANCDRSATVTNAQGRRFVAIKKPGFYTIITSQ